jgi:hypothetical protein
MSDVRRLVIIPDTQIPFQNKRQVASLIRFIGDEQPEEIIHIGDLMDYPQPSRWNKDTRREFEGSVKRDSQEGKRFLASLYYSRGFTECDDPVAVRRDG